MALVSEARRLNLLVGGHLVAGDVTAGEASDSGANIIDHLYGGGWAGEVPKRCFGEYGSVDGCQRVAERFLRNNTWFAPTRTALISSCSKQAKSTCAHFSQYMNAFWAGTLRHDNWLRDSVTPGMVQSESPDTLGDMYFVHRTGLPILAGTDAREELLKTGPPGFSLHLELAIYAAEGLTPLEALRTATLNPAKLLKGTDSLGTVAPGKLADLVLLDANPLADITNTTTIRAVVANGRYFDRAALDRVLIETQARVKQQPDPMPRR